MYIILCLYSLYVCLHACLCIVYCVCVVYACMYKCTQQCMCLCPCLYVGSCIQGVRRGNTSTHTHILHTRIHCIRQLVVVHAPISLDYISQLYSYTHMDTYTHSHTLKSHYLEHKETKQKEMIPIIELIITITCTPLPT